VAVGDWRRAGFVPQALLGYLVLLGFHPGDDRELLTRDELLQAFSLDRLGSSGSVFDSDKLRWVNAHWLHHASGEQLADWAADRGADGEPFLPAAAQALPADSRTALLGLVRGNLATLADLAGELAPFLGETPAREPDAEAALGEPRAAQVCLAYADALAELAEWSADGVKSALKTTGTQLGVKGRELFQPVRAALTGRTHGPELPQVAVWLGRERCVARLRAAAAAR